MQLILLFFLIFILNYLLLIFFKKISSSIGMVDKSDNFQTGFASSVPTGGGLIFAISFLASFYLLYFFKSTPINSYLPNNYYMFFFSAILFNIIGFIDDKISVHIGYRIIFQIILCYLTITCFELYKVQIPLKILILLIMLFWIYIINVINFIDGTDGFLSIISLNFFIVIFLITTFDNIDPFLRWLSLTMIAIISSFLVMNKPIAKMFMGDAGSIFLGFLIGFCFIKISIDGYFFVALSLLSYPLADCTLTIILKVFKGHYPWERMFDYFFLIPIKKKIENKFFVFKNNIYCHILIFTITTIQIFSQLDFLFILSYIVSIYFLLKYKNKKFI